VNLLKQYVNEKNGNSCEKKNIDIDRKKLNILVVCQQFYPEIFKVNDICKDLVLRGHNVTVLCAVPNDSEGNINEEYKNGNKREEDVDGIHVVRVPVLKRGKKKIALFFNYLSFIITGKLKARTLAKKQKFDIVFCYQLSPSTMALPAKDVARKQKIPFIMYVLDLWPESAMCMANINSKFVENRLHKMMDKIYNQSNSIFVSSKSFIERIEKRGQPGGKIHFWPQHAEDYYIRKDVCEKNEIADQLPSGFNIIFTGNVGYAQNLNCVVDAAQIIKENKEMNINWIIVGSGRAKEDIQRYAKEKNVEDCVLFLGRVPGEDISDYLAISDVALMVLQDKKIFSITLPAKLQSYFACGMPVIACIGGEGAQVVLEACAGVACDTIDAKGLADAAKKMYFMHKNDLKKMGDNAEQYAHINYKKKVLFDYLEDHMYELIGK